MYIETFGIYSKKNQSKQNEPDKISSSLLSKMEYKLLRPFGVVERILSIS
jgi:hypothetical protein